MIEKQILSMIMHDPTINVEVLKTLNSEDFKDNYCKRLFEFCKKIYSDGYSPTYATILREGLKLSLINTDNQKKLEEIAKINSDSTLDKLIKELKNPLLKNNYNPLKPKITCLNDVEMEEVNWLWYMFLACKKITMLEGDPGQGKTFLALAIIAIITNGWPFPDKTGKPDRKRVREPRNVLYMTAEDGVSDTIKPRLEMLGADHRRVFMLDGFYEENDPENIQAVSLKDLNILRSTFEQVQPALLVVDPLQAYLGTGVDMHRANEVRPILSAILRLAEEFDCAVILIRHLNKSTGGNVAYRGMGSIDFTAAARSVLLVGRDPDDKNKRVVIQTKSSLAAEAPAIGFSLDENGFTWTGISDLTAEQVLSSMRDDNGDKNAVDEAKDFLEDILQSGPVPSNEIFSKGSKYGISKASIRRAKEKLDIRAFREPGGGRNALWLWQIRCSNNLYEQVDHLIESPNITGTGIDAQDAQDKSMSACSEGKIFKEIEHDLWAMKNESQGGEY